MIKLLLWETKSQLQVLYYIAGSHTVIYKAAFMRNEIAFEILKTKLGDSNENQSQNGEIYIFDYLFYLFVNSTWKWKEASIKAYIEFSDLFIVTPKCATTLYQSPVSLQNTHHIQPTQHRSLYMSGQSPKSVRVRHALIVSSQPYLAQRCITDLRSV